MKTIVKRKEKIAKKIIDSLANETKLEPLIVEFLYSKGYKTSDEILKFINFKETDLRDVSKMKDGEVFLQRLTDAVKKKEHIVVFGDYDGDGVCATAIFVKTLKWLNANVDWFISNRFKEGYGLSVKSMQRLLDTYSNIDLIVTCDNGIVAFDGIKLAKESGIDVLVSDHHNASPDGRLPDCPVVCEKRLDEDATVCEGFCGAELVRRLCVELVARCGKKTSLKQAVNSLYALSGFATITDVIELNASNHFIAKTGLEVMNKKPDELHWLKALKKSLEIKDEIDEVTIGYKLGPAINACGRILGVADKAVCLMLANNMSKANKYADELVAINELRQEKSLEQQKIANKEIAEKNLQDDDFIVLYGFENEHYEEGIAGLVASFVVDNYKKPAIVLCPTEDPKIYKGSGRSVEGFNLKVALDNSKDLLLGYGGHPMAAGLSIHIDNIEQLSNSLNHIAQMGDEFNEVIELDFLERPEGFSMKVLNQYRKHLAPFGAGFEKPNFAIAGYFGYDYTVMKEKHIKSIIFSKDNDMLDLLWFNSLTKMEMMDPCGKKIIAIGEPSINEFRGKKTRQFIVDKLFIIN